VMTTLRLAQPHSLTHARTHSITRSLTHSLTHSPTHPLTHSPTHSLTHSLTHSSTHPPTHPLTHSPTLFCHSFPLSLCLSVKRQDTERQLREKGAGEKFATLPLVTAQPTYAYTTPLCLQTVVDRLRRPLATGRGVCRRFYDSMRRDLSVCQTCSI